MRIRHLLSMTSGHDHCTMADMQHAPDWGTGIFPLRRPYTSRGRTSATTPVRVTCFPPAVVRATKESLCDYLRPRLFGPLGIAPRLWELSPQGIETWRLGIQPHDGGDRLVRPVSARRRAARRASGHSGGVSRSGQSIQSDNSMNDQPDWKVGYGFQFWRCRHNAFRGDGAFGQYAIAMPEQGIAIAITSGLRNMQQILDLVWDFVLPAAQNSALPPAAEEESALRQELAAWAMPVLTSAGAELRDGFITWKRTICSSRNSHSLPRGITWNFPSTARHCVPDSAFRRTIFSRGVRRCRAGSRPACAGFPIGSLNCWRVVTRRRSSGISSWSSETIP